MKLVESKNAFRRDVAIRKRRCQNMFKTKMLAVVAIFLTKITIIVCLKTDCNHSPSTKSIYKFYLNIRFLEGLTERD